MTKSELIAALREAKGADRELDAQIWLSFTPGATREHSSYIHTVSGKVCEIDETRENHRLIIVKEFTSSLDAAVALVERVRPGWGWDVSSSGMALMYSNPRMDNAQLGRATTPAIALLIALLESHDEKPESDLRHVSH